MNIGLRITAAGLCRNLTCFPLLNAVQRYEKICGCANFEWKKFLNYKKCTQDHERIFYFTKYYLKLEAIANAGCKVPIELINE